MRVKNVRCRAAVAVAVLAATFACTVPAFASPGFTSVTRVEGTGDTSVNSITNLADGGQLIGGRFSGTAAFGGVVLTSVGSNDGFVARRNADGTYAWAQRFGGMGYDNVQATAVAADGSLLVVAVLDQGVHARTTIAKLSSGGAEVWTRDVWGPYSGGSSSVVTAIGENAIALADGGFAIVGEGVANGFCHCIAFGSRLTDDREASIGRLGAQDAWVARLSSSGTFMWAKGFGGGTGHTYGSAVAQLPSDVLAIGGAFEDAASFGTIPLLSAATDPTHANAFVARVAAADGTVMSAATIPATDYSTVYSLDASGDGHLLVGGVMAGSASFVGTGSLTRSNPSAFVALQNPGGEYAWSSAPEPDGAGLTAVDAVVLRSDGTSLVTGTISASARFGDTTITSSSQASSAFVAGVSADGRFRWAVSGGTTAPYSQTVISGFAARADGASLMGANMYRGDGDATFGSATLVGGSNDVGGFVGLLDVPVAPAAPTPTAGVNQATVAITPIAGSAITGYVVTAIPGGSTCAVAAGATSCAVTGLTPGTAYTFTVTATNSAGTSAASAASAAVTPTAPTSVTPRLARAPKIVRSGSSVSLVSSVQVGAPGTLAQSATYVGSARAARAVTACTAKAQAKKAGTVTITCKLNAKARAALRKGALKLTLTTTFTETGKTASSTTRRVTVPRAKPSTRASHGLLG